MDKISRYIGIVVIIFGMLSCSKAGIVMKALGTSLGIHPDKEELWIQAGFSLYRIASETSNSIASDWRDGGFSDPMEAKEWRDRNFSATEAKMWWYMNFSATEAKDWQCAGFKSPIEAKQWKTKGFDLVKAQTWKETGFLNPDEAEKWRSESFHHEEAWSWHAAGFLSNDANEWKKAGCGLQETIDWNRFEFTYIAALEWKEYDFGPKEANEWRNTGLKNNPNLAKIWKENGFVLEEVKKWIKAGFLEHPTRAADWKKAGFSLDYASQAKKYGVSIEEANDPKVIALLKPKTQKAINGYQKFKWGMTKDEVIKEEFCNYRDWDDKSGLTKLRINTQKWLKDYVKIYDGLLENYGIEDNLSHDIYNFRKNISGHAKEIGYGVTALECYDFPFMGHRSLGGFLFIDGKLQRIVFEVPIILDQSKEKEYMNKLNEFRKELNKNDKEIERIQQNSDESLETKIKLREKAGIKIIQESDLPETLKNFLLITIKLSKKYGRGTDISNFEINNIQSLEMRYAEDTVILREFPISLQKSKMNITGLLLIYTSKDYDNLLLQAQNKQLEDEL